ncbi:NAD dependent epimerase/dehydratase family [Sphingobacterium spiritivorum]|uniref:NAD dependent epimerase/dehydratase family n=1 Tax=Sphingobacterium spiritivorum TaxID=258 RepID=A0A380CV21_SPHSI|nr:NAD-dependent epimerase/dehydratase family protein [Sphingobacterium spiritivorum]SUJ28680.1 NAD dependent epimerase/dehydratase family [Sphingobacterium spiritivorum]
MQTILGANGQIAEELAKELHRAYTTDIRLVSRSPKKVNDTDTLFIADLRDKVKADEAVAGSTIVYFTLGLPMDTRLWENQFPILMRNVIEACQKHKAKLVFFDNTYMYPQNGAVLTEESIFAPVGKKGMVRKKIADMLLSEMEAGQIEAVICRAPEFYGPGKTQSITNTFIFDRIKENKKLLVLLRDDTLRSLIWTPDASKATALIGNTPDAYGQTWHLPVDDNRRTYRTFIELVSDVYGKPLSYSVVPNIILKLGAVFNRKTREIQELLPRYAYDNIFNSDKFKKRFPDFSVTSFREGITQIKKEYQQQ